MNSKRFLSACLAAIIGASALAGCSGGQSAPASSGSDAAPASSAAPAASSEASGGAAAAPSGQLKELTIFSDFSSNAAKVIKSYEENIVFQTREEQTGVHVTWNHPPAGQSNEQFNLMVSSGDLPDVIMYGWNSVSGGALKYVNDGIIIDLTPYMDQYAPSFIKLMEENPEARKQIVDDNSNYYYLPMLRLEDKLRVVSGPQIRVDWLNKLNLEKPKTIDELYNVLKAFKEQDPNGNGEADEFPMTGQKFRGTNGIGNMVGAWGTSWDYYVKDGKILFGPVQPEFKEGLEFIVKCFSEGLIDPDYMLNDRTKQDAKVTGGISGFLYAIQPATFMRTMAESGREPDFLVEGMTWPTGKDGVAYALLSEYDNMAVGPCAAITTEAKYPEETLQWLDYAYSDEGNILFNLGIEGDTFHWDGDKAVYEDKVLNDDQGGYGTFNMALNGWAMSQSTLYHEQLMWQYGYPAAEFWRPADRSLPLPSLTFTDEETKRVSKLKTDIDTYVDEMLDKFTTGKEPMANWDSYVAAVNGMGLEELTAIYQASYDRYQAR